MNRRPVKEMRKRGIVLAALAALSFAWSCRGGAEADSGSETHFLRVCPASCNDGLECICGVCTARCSDDAVCRELAGSASCVSLAARIAEGRCQPEARGQVCDASCLVAADCARLGQNFVCDAGYCRDVPQNQAPAPVAECTPPSYEPDQIVILGDVLIELTVFGSALAEHAVSAGQLAEGMTFRNYASHLTSTLAEGPFSIGNEYTTALQGEPPKLVVLDGGATDFLNDPCTGMLNDECPAVKAAISGAELLFQRFAQGGVEQIVYFFYGDPVGDPGLKAGLDLLRPLLRNACGRSAVPCHWLDLRELFAPHPEYVGADGLVFSEAGARASAAAVWKVMEDRCLVPRTSDR
ncbi:MAG TPA: hypothetical protein VFQ61_05045 [Polyangiaceae bacterium]|nr:hypothetical protein [Polyangiaceae bacterium]